MQGFFFQLLRSISILLICSVFIFCDFISKLLSMVITMLSSLLATEYHESEQEIMQLLQNSHINYKRIIIMSLLV